MLSLLSLFCYFLFILFLFLCEFQSLSSSRFVLLLFFLLSPCPLLLVLFLLLFLSPLPSAISSSFPVLRFSCSFLLLSVLRPSGFFRPNFRCSLINFIDACCLDVHFSHDPIIHLNPISVTTPSFTANYCTPKCTQTMPPWPTNRTLITTSFPMT